MLSLCVSVCLSVCLSVHLYLFSSWSTGLAEKLTGPQLIRKFPAFYRTRRFITAFTRARHLSLSWARSMRFLLSPSHFSKMYFNIVVSSKPWSSERSSFRLSHQDPVCPIRATCLAHLICWPTEWYLVRSTEHRAPCYAGISSWKKANACLF